MDRLEAILFDFDGVLLDSEPVHCECWKQALRPLGVPVSWDVYALQCVGTSDKDMIRTFAAMCEPPADPATLWAEYPVKKRLFQERMAVDPPFAPGVDKFFQELSRSYRLGVVSSSASSEIEPLLQVAGIRPYLETVVSGDDVQRHKPAPDPYLLAAKRLGITRALVVEDSPAGMESARAAGFEAIRIADPRQMMDRVRQRLNGVR